MTKGKAIITAVVAALTVAVVALKFTGADGAAGGGEAAAKSAGSAESARSAAGLPTMLELGSTTCVPCKMMESVLDSLREKYSKRLRVEFVDVTQNRDVGFKYKIKLIPTQIFLDASGNEVFRHEGFFPEEEIVAKWRELGVDLGQSTEASVDGAGEGVPEKAGGDATTSDAGWLSNLFGGLAADLKKTAVIAFAAAFVWGVLSILLSPCHLSSIPLIVGFINDQEEMTTRRAFVLATLFAGGILATIAVIGVATAATGHMLGDLGSWTSYFVAGIFLLVGLHLLDVFPMPWSGPGRVKMERKGLLAALVLGLVFGVAIGPCTFAYMAPMLAIVVKEAVTDMAYGVALLLFYGVGHCAVIVFAGTFTEWIQRYLDWNEESKGAVYLKRACAVLVVVTGLYLIYKA